MLRGWYCGGCPFCRARMRRVSVAVVRTGEALLTGMVRLRRICLACGAGDAVGGAPLRWLYARTAEGSHSGPSGLRVPLVHKLKFGGETRDRPHPGRAARRPAPLPEGAPAVCPSLSTGPAATARVQTRRPCLRRSWPLAGAGTGAAAPPCPRHTAPGAPQCRRTPEQPCGRFPCPGAPSGRAAPPLFAG
jgi:hypothetical protein